MKSNALLFLMSIAFYQTTFCSQQNGKSAQEQAKDGKEAREQVKSGQDQLQAIIKNDAQYEEWKKTEYKEWKDFADAIPQERKNEQAYKAIQDADKNRVIFWLDNGVSPQTVFDEAAVGMYHYTRENKDFHWDLVHFSLQLGADPMECIDRDMLQVYLAADLAPRAQSLLDRMLSDSRTKLDEEGQGSCTMLQEATWYGNTYLVKELLFLGVKPHSNREKNIVHSDSELNIDRWYSELNDDSDFESDGVNGVFRRAQKNPEILGILKQAKKNNFSFMSKEEQEKFNSIAIKRLVKQNVLADRQARAITSPTRPQRIPTARHSRDRITTKSVHALQDASLRRNKKDSTKRLLQDDGTVDLSLPKKTKVRGAQEVSVKTKQDSDRVSSAYANATADTSAYVKTAAGTAADTSSSSSFRRSACSFLAQLTGNEPSTLASSANGLSEETRQAVATSLASSLLDQFAEDVTLDSRYLAEFDKED